MTFKPTATIIALCLATIALSRGAAADSIYDANRSASVDSIMNGEYDAATPTGRSRWMLRLAIAKTWPDDRYVENQLEPFVDGDLTYPNIGGWLGVSRATGHCLFELDAGFDWFQDSMFDDRTEVDIVGLWAELWARYSLGDPLVLRPGLGIGYSSNQIEMGKVEEVEPVEEEADRLGVLNADGMIVSVGVMLDWFLARRFSLMADYRYRYASFDADVSNGGDFYFPGDAEMDPSGHYVSIGISVGFPDANR